MAERPTNVSPRKKPKQRRAVSTVDAILQAAACILIQEGWQKLTTNRVALRAGVNIASLYQYFPNKEAIIAELHRRHVDRVRQHFPREAQTLRSLPTLRAVLRSVVQVVIAEHRNQPELHRIFSEELPRTALGPLAVSSHDLERLWRECLATHAVNVPDLDMAAFVVRTVVHAIVHDTAVGRPQLLTHPAFAEEVVTLIERYLRRPSPTDSQSAAGNAECPKG